MYIYVYIYIIIINIIIITIIITIIIIIMITLSHEGAYQFVEKQSKKSNLSSIHQLSSHKLLSANVLDLGGR